MPDIRIVLQARLSSRRLPAKCLLPVGGFPLVVLSALRAGNTGLATVLATSSESEDQALAELADAHQIPCVRGPLDDVFARFLLATEGLPDDAWVVRLTADNCFPDGHFVQDLIKQAESKKVVYLGTSSPLDGLPYGLSAEVFKVSALRECAGDLSAFDREHVTPAIKRKFGAQLACFGNTEQSQLRCTIDTGTDYFRMRTLFAGVDDPISISWKTLCKRLAQEEGAPEFRIPWKLDERGAIGKLTLGTAQLGLEQYGRTNRTGMPSLDEARQLLDTAVRHGITHIDTARAYGESEVQIGRILRDGLYAEPIVVTKLDPLAGLDENATNSEVSKWVEASVYQSLHALGRPSLPILMLHRWAHFKSHYGTIWNTLMQLQEQGMLGELGASVYTPKEAVEAMSEPKIRHLQIPFNLLDHRWRSESFRKVRESRPDVLVYGRSAYLQGLLVSGPDAWPRRGGFEPDPLLEVIDRLVQDLGRHSRADLCLAYLNASPLIDSVVMGMETVDQLRENLSLACRPPLTISEIEIVEKSIPEVPEWLLDPGQWS